MGRRPLLEKYRPNAADAGLFTGAEDLTRADFVKLTTAQDDFHVPPSVRQIDAAWALEEFTLPPMLRDAVTAWAFAGW